MIQMDAHDLLAVSPRLLAQAILHRRERLSDMIPNDLQAHKEEQLEAEPLAKSARDERDKINEKVKGLKQERNISQKKARALFEKANDIREELIATGGMKNPDPKWAKEKLAAKLENIERQLETNAGTHKTEERYIKEMRSLMREHQEWVDERSASQPLVDEMRNAQKEAKKLLDSAQKAHDAMAELVEANAERHQSFIHWEEVRRRSTSRAKKLQSALDSSQDALEFWQYCIEKDDFTDLLIAQKRVVEGGPSSKAISKSAKKKPTKKQGGEEE